MPQASPHKFTSSLGFLAAASGAAIGLANIWKFPYEVGSHGGAWYLVMYTFFVLVLGYPLVLVKTALGRRQGKGLYEVYRSHGKWNLLAWLPLSICMGVLSFYNVVTGWILGYGVEMLRGNCLGRSDMDVFFKSFIGNVEVNLGYNAVICVSVMLIVNMGVQKGIEKWSKILMPLFMVMLLSLIAYALMLEGAVEGVKFYLLPNASLLTMKSLSSALAHAFLSLALGTGVMITYGAYADEKGDIVQDARLVVAADFCVAFLAGLLIFPLIFHSGIEPDEGPALIFIALPSVLHTLGDVQGVLIGASLFLLLVFAAITSAISMLEIPVKYAMERWGFSRSKSVLCIGCTCYVLGLASLLSHGGSDFFTHFMTYKGGTLSFMEGMIAFFVDLCMPLSAMLFCLFIGKRWDDYCLSDEIDTQGRYGLRHGKLVYICVKYVAPILIALILMTNFCL